MATGGAALFLSCALFFFFRYTASPAFSCPDISPSYCKENPMTPFNDPQACGVNSHVRCRDSAMEIQFGGIEPWYKVIKAGDYDKELEIEDPTLSLIFKDAADCSDFLFTFPPPGPPFTSPETLRVSDQALQSYCTESDCRHLFSGLIKRYQGGPCTGYDLYCTSKELQDLRQPALRNICLPGPDLADTPMFIWKLAENYADGSFRILSAGFSRRYWLHPDCFMRNMTGGGDCESGSAGNYTRGSTSWTLSTRKRKLIIGVSIGTSGFLLVCITLCCWYYGKHDSLRSIWTMKSRNSQNVEAFLEQYGTSIPKRYRYAEVKKITKSFTEELGKGGYGTVFKGKLLDGRLVAVKVFNSKESIEEFINEVASIGRTHHVNIVNLLGFCCEGSKRALLYEFMSNGSLEKFIFLKKSEDMTCLGWKKLLEIAIGIARGLEYLYRGCSTRIVHFDIKPHNILLDEDFCPKISDFGLAKPCHPKESILSIVGIRGTIGYIAPEVFSRKFGSVSNKSDVYSYGMIILEMVGGRMHIDARTDGTSDMYFPHWIYEHFNGNAILQLYGITNETQAIAKKMILVGLWCIQTIPSSRPSINKVLEMLEGDFEELQMPPKPYLSSP